ncbi:hypothetical protein HKO22_02855 [Peptoniphilus sp. AGMB00490]|uniref:Uncharacterized protein n=1 Tax=Peptoniphilus faecalis TaxID=2731255 RepID=A0A848RGY6_9FIRM|nr:hypothetical protein [Peptoniphilus faecalis]NMW84683.1 hypothetical protein [Peptoniphilus faecalis]
MSLNKLGLKFDLIGMLRDLEKTLSYRVIALIDEMVLELNSKDFEYATGTFKKELIEMSEDYVKYKIGSPHWYSWIVNYGKGSAMASDNPFLQDYMNDDVLWNDARDKLDRTIVPRHKGVHEVPNWEAGEGTKPLYGSNNTNYNLEEKGDPRFLPRYPSRYLDRVMLDSKDRLISEINNVFRTFPYSDYLKGGG